MGATKRTMVNPVPKYMDVHKMEGITAEDAAHAHRADLKIQGKHGARFLRYWVNEEEGVVFCLSEAPTKQAALDTHEEAGHPPDEIFEVIERE